MSRSLLDEAHEDLLERALARLEILEVDAEIGQLAEQRRDLRALVARGVEDVDEPRASFGELEAVARERVRHPVERTLELEDELFFPELLHQRGLLFDEDDLALADDADAVSHLLGFF